MLTPLKARQISWVALALTMAMGAAAHGDDAPLPLGEEARCWNAAPYTEYVPSTEDVTLEDILARPGEFPFQPLPNGNVNFGIDHAVYWFRLSMRNDSDSGRGLRIDLNNPRLISVVCYQPSVTGNYAVQRSGISEPYDSRLIASRNPAFYVYLRPGEVRTVYLRVMHQGSMRFLLRVWSPSLFNSHRAGANLLQGVFYGAIFLMAIQSFYVGAALRQLGFILHGLLNAAYLAFTASMQGLTYQYLWPNSPWWADKSVLVFFGFAFALFFFFSLVFLETRRYAPRLGFALKICGSLALVVAVGSMTGSVFFNRLGHLLGTVGPLLIIAAAINVRRKGHPLAHLFLIAWAILLMGIFLLALLGQGLVPNSFWTENCLHIGAGIALLLFSFALTQQVKLMEQRYHGRLEFQVAERTAQLTDALENVKTLKGLIPICSSCKKVRDDQGFWSRIETYLQKHSDADLTHGLCPDCAASLYGKHYPAAPPEKPAGEDGI